MPLWFVGECSDCVFGFVGVFSHEVAAETELDDAVAGLKGDECSGFGHVRISSFRFILVLALVLDLRFRVGVLAILFDLKVLVLP